MRILKYVNAPQTPRSPQATPQSHTNTSHPSDTRDAIQKSNKIKLIWGLVCLLGPTLLIILSIAAYAITTVVSAPVDSNDLFTPASPGVRIVNIFLFLLGALAVATWLPGFIIGVILLATRRKLQ